MPAALDKTKKIKKAFSTSAMQGIFGASLSNVQEIILNAESDQMCSTFRNIAMSLYLIKHLPCYYLSYLDLEVMGTLVY